MESKQFIELVSRASEKIFEEPGLYGWEVGGYIVAPATVDPYVLSTAAVQEVLKDLRQENSPSLKIPTMEETGAILSQFFKIAYATSGTVFRPGARKFLQDLQKHSDLRVVTNSDTKAVEAKIVKLLGTEHGIKIVGNAKKYVVTPEFNLVTEKLRIGGLERPVFLRRGLYYKALMESGGLPDAVIGDIWELDLAMPDMLGVKTVLITQKTTPIWERLEYKDRNWGFSSNHLGEISDRLLLK